MLPWPRFLTEAGTAVLDFAFTPRPEGLEQVGWNAYAGNHGSARVAQKHGFRFEAVAWLGGGPAR
ncbi:GNAT family N-acetyltransferase [Paeniglutamicibacter cryotolerans]|uniref:RimJ/RimL family protein N-acetyltransferase n=1 Tax=Paeniglutamicibacter cryotolerans TaxID=670079 RepID=A0A839QG91_9MICC|nr:GNAT family N-acetyltransferase [Paeniglutamicibacter cryotolerans]MBB2995338.1 RimJ/RimL family protein N-acetyltransferase [Paeniglutamicibacter cryotolerans]